MSKENGLKPREGCAWTEDRCEQFRKLEQLLHSVSMLNHSTNFLDNVQECIEISGHLRKWDMGYQSFTHFLAEQIIEDRFPKGGAE